MRAEIISIGDELTSGQRLDTNSQWLSQRLAEFGIRVLYHTTVGDDLEANVAVFRQAIARVDLVVATGGLGPTEDDLTRQALARAAGLELELDHGALEHIEQLFRKRQRDMPPANRVQALFPRGSRIIPNRNGTAPGIDLAVSRADGSSACVFALPGVPAEMRELWRESVAPAIEQRWGASRRRIRHRAIHCFGAGESEIEQMLPNLIVRGRVPQVGITASDATITLRISAEGASDDECQSLIEPTAQLIYRSLGSLVFGEGEDQLEEVVLRELARRRERLSVVESGTQGLVTQRFFRCDHEAFAGGKSIAAPAAPAHSPQAASPHSDTNSPAADFARMACDEFGTEWGLGIGPVTRPDDSSGVDRLPVAICHQQAVATHSFAYTGHPDLLQTRAAKQAVNWLRLRLT